MRVIILSSSTTSSLDVWDEEPKRRDVDVVDVRDVDDDVRNPPTCRCHRRRPGRSRSPSSLC